MRKLDIVNHELMPKNRTCHFVLENDGYMSYIMDSSESEIYYEIVILPIVGIELLTYEGKVYKFEAIEKMPLNDLIMTRAHYFCVNIFNSVTEKRENLYSRFNVGSNYILN